MNDFTARGVTVVAVSVDKPDTSRPWKQKKGFTFALASDPDMALIDGRFHIRNPQEKDLALHAIYIVDGKGRIYYRKVARRRAMPGELLDAIDFHRGTYKPPAPPPAKAP